MSVVIYRQLLIFATVGLLSNSLLYLAYILLTHFGVGHKTAMTLAYTAGVGTTFILNRNITFGHRGHIRPAFIKYLLTYVLGYVLNFAGLYLWVDRLGYNHAYVQLVLIFSIAVLLFLIQKLFVFGGVGHNTNLFK